MFPLCPKAYQGWSFLPPVLDLMEPDYFDEIDSTWGIDPWRRSNMANQSGSGGNKSSGGSASKNGNSGGGNKSSSGGGSKSASGSGDDNKSSGTQGGSREQHAEAGRQSHKNDDK